MALTTKFYSFEIANLVSSDVPYAFNTLVRTSALNTPAAGPNDSSNPISIGLSTSFAVSSTLYTAPASTNAKIIFNPGAVFTATASFSAGASHYASATAAITWSEICSPISNCMLPVNFYGNGLNNLYRTVYITQSGINLATTNFAYSSAFTGARSLFASAAAMRSATLTALTSGLGSAATGGNIANYYNFPPGSASSLSPTSSAFEKGLSFFVGANQSFGISINPFQFAFINMLSISYSTAANPNSISLSYSYNFATSVSYLFSGSFVVIEESGT